MNEKEKYRAEIDAKLAKFGETLHAIKSKQAIRDAMRPTLDIDATIGKHKAAQAKIRTLERSDANSWPGIKTEVDRLMGDIDDDLRKAMSFYK